MPDVLRIDSHPRTEFGKGAARRTRRDGRVPAVLYGHGIDPVHLSLPGHESMLALKNPNALLTLALPDGDHLALAKAVQRHAIKGHLEHIDLLLVRRGERVTVDVTIHLVGELQPDSLAAQELSEISIEVPATHIPDRFEVSIDGLRAGDSITAGDVSLPGDATLVTEPDHVVVAVLAAPTAEQLEAETEELEAEAGVERAEPEPAEADEAAPAAEEGEES